MAKVKIFTLIGQEIVRLGLRTLLEQADDFTIVGEAENLGALDHSILKFSPDMVILDFYHSQDETIEAIRKVKRTHPGIRVLIYTNDDSEEIFFRAFHSGADGFLLRTTDVKSVVEALQTLRRGELYFGPQISELMLKRFLAKPQAPPVKTADISDILTKRETEILTFIALGMTNQEIADKLFISFRTVHTHRNNLMKKLNAHGTAQLVRYAIEKGLVTTK